MAFDAGKDYRADWETPAWLFEELDREFNFSLDPCASDENAKCALYFTEREDGLAQSWADPLAWIRETLPLEALQLAKALVGLLTDAEYFKGNLKAFGERGRAEGRLELKGYESLIELCNEIGAQLFENRRGLSAIGIPAPGSALVVLAGLFGPNSANAKELVELLDRWLVHHLKLHIKGISRRPAPFASAGCIGELLVDSYAAFAVEEAGGPNHAVHVSILSCLGGLIEVALNGVKSVYVNSPYGREIARWMAKARQEADKGATVVCLVPARLDTNWWHETCHRSEVRFRRGRVNFVGGTAALPAASAVVVMRPGDMRRQPKPRGGWLKMMPWALIKAI